MLRSEIILLCCTARLPTQPGIPIVDCGSGFPSDNCHPFLHFKKQSAPQRFKEIYMPKTLMHNRLTSLAADPKGRVSRSLLYPMKSAWKEIATMHKNNIRIYLFKPFTLNKQISHQYLLPQPISNFFEILKAKKNKNI